MTALTVPRSPDTLRPGDAPAAHDRVALARAVLARAEERTGAGSWVRPLRPVPVEPAEPEGTEASEVPVAADPDRADAADADLAARCLPVPGALAALLPSGGLDRGSTVVAAGSTSLALGLLTSASQAGGWVALVGLPSVGVLAAHGLGLDLDRVVLVPDPGPDAPTVVAALLDGVDVVVVGPVALSPADRRRLSARARERSAVLLPTTPWPGAHVVLTAEASRWDGLGHGHGRLRTGRVVVRRTGRGSAARQRRFDVVLPAAPGWADAPVGGAVGGALDGVVGGALDGGVGFAPAEGWRAG